MQKKVFLGSLVGGVIVFLWCWVSWMLLPWHCVVLKKFSDEKSVSHVIQSNAFESGVYVLPNMYAYDDSTPSDEMEEGMKMMQSGPMMFASVQIQGMEQKTARPFIISLILQIIGAGIVSWMLLQTKKLSYQRKVGFVVLYGVAVGVLGILPAWNWWCLSLGYTASIFFDLIIGWLLAGFAIAKICK